MPKGIRVLYFLNGGASTISKAVHELNEEIRDKEIRLIGDDGEQLGIMTPDAALASVMLKIPATVFNAVLPMIFTPLLAKAIRTGLKSSGLNPEF